MQIAHVAQSVEHVLGKDEVTGSIPVMGSKHFIFSCIGLSQIQSIGKRSTYRVQGKI
jgi:hypothetical protein